MRKLNIKQTVFIGLGFLTIMMLWGVYNKFIPLFLNDYIEGLVKGDKLWIGVIMALDNLVALFMIPLMSKLSDRTISKLGKRMPFIIVGILLSAFTFALIPTINESGKPFLLIGAVFLVLVSMNIYRSPCVALMPDVTLKENRNKANSIINILGGVGTALGYLLNLVFAQINPYVCFYVCSALMIFFLIIMLFKVKENKMVEEYRDICDTLGINLEEERLEALEASGSSTDKNNVIWVLVIVFLVYMANNAAETWLSLYGQQVYDDAANVPFNLDPSTLVLIPFGVATFICAYPSAIMGDKFGRKITILIGCILMTVGYFFTGIFGTFLAFDYLELVSFGLCGVGFSFITINIYPMVLENCSEQDIGKYTGQYYSSSMLAQSITPVISGLIMSNLVFNSMQPLFYYCAFFMVLATICSLLIKHHR